MLAMYRGTTPTFVFEIDTGGVELDVKTIWLTFSQGKVGITKTQDDVYVTEDSRIIVTLSQDETLQFESGKTVEVQARILTTEGKALATEILQIHANRILKGGLIE